MPKKRKRKVARKGKGKGGKFEREICREISLWWTAGARDDYFWRTSTSGGRATVRSRKGKKTHGQYGDICATHPDGRALMRFFVFELKRGYSSQPLATLFDTMRSADIYERWITQATQSRNDAGARNWAIVSRRNNGHALITMAFTTIEDLILMGAVCPRNMIRMSIAGVPCVTYRFEDFLRRVRPKLIREFKRL